MSGTTTCSKDEILDVILRDGVRLQDCFNQRIYSSTTSLNYWTLEPSSWGIMERDQKHQLSINNYPTSVETFERSYSSNKLAALLDIQENLLQKIQKEMASMEASGWTPPTYYDRITGEPLDPQPPSLLERAKAALNPCPCDPPPQNPTELLEDGDLPEYIDEAVEE